MAIIFQNKRIQKDDTGSKMKFPGDANLTNLPFSYNTPGQFISLRFTDEGDTAQKTLNIANENGKVRFTQGWEAFRKKKGIEVGHEISLYADGKISLDGHGKTDRYRIIAEKTEKNGIVSWNLHICLV